MGAMNKVILMGNLTRSPDLKTLPSGNVVCEFGLAIKRNYTSQSGDQREEITDVELSCFGRGGEVIQQYCDKGSPLFVEGRLRFDSGQNDQGEKRNRLTVIVDNFQLLPDGKHYDGCNVPSNKPTSGNGDGIPPVNKDPF